MVDLADSVFRDFETDGVPASGAHKPKKQKIRELLTDYKASIDAFTSNGGLIYGTKAQLDADLAHGANSSAWVVADPTVANNGIYRKSGASGAGSWSRVADLPYSFIGLKDDGAGTADAIVATSSIPLPASPSAALLVMNVFEANTGAVTIAANGGAAKALVTNTGTALGAGYLAAGMFVAFIDTGANYRLMTDIVSSSIVAAAEAAAAEAEAAKDLAVAAANAFKPPLLDTIAALKTLTADDVVVGGSAVLRYGAALGGYGDSEFLVFAGSAAANGYTADDVVIVENNAATITFVRKQWWHLNECDLRWFGPALDGTTDSASAITAWYTACNALAVLRGRVKAVVPDIGVAFKTSVTVIMGSGFVLTGGGLLECHSSMAQGLNLLRTNSLTAGLGLYGQEYIELDNIRLSGANRNLTIGSLQGLVRIYATRRVVIANVEAYGQQSHLIALAGNDSVTFGDNVNLHDWGHPSNGIAVTNAVNNGSGLIRLTVSSTVTMATGNTRIVNGVQGVTNANGSWTVTVINGTTVDLQGSTFAGSFSGTSGKISSGVDGGSAIIAIANPTDETVHRHLQIGDGVYIHNGNWTGIQCMSDWYIINGVIIKTVKEAGIFARNQDATAPGNFVRTGKISNCIIEGVTRAYIDAAGIVGGGLKQTIADNTVRNCDNIGISIVSEANEVLVLGNQVVNGNQDPVMFASGGGIVLRDASSTLSPSLLRVSFNRVRDENAPKVAKYGIAIFRVSPSTNAIDDVEITENDVYISAAATGDNLFIEAAAVGNRWKVGSNRGSDVSAGIGLTVVARETQTFDIGSVGANASINVDRTVTGAATGDIVLIGLPANGAANGLLLKGFVLSADTVRINVCNVTTGAIDPANSQYIITVIR